MLEKNQLYKRVLDVFGINNQLMVTVEECSELIKECSKMYRQKGNIGHLSEEIADVLIMCEQLIKYYNLKPQVENMMQEKLKRLKHRLEGAERKTC